MLKNGYGARTSRKMQLTIAEQKNPVYQYRIFDQTFLQTVKLCFKRFDFFQNGATLFQIHTNKLFLNF
ncbi:hypothetical protein SAMN05878482_109122 [Peribacillus simplex]|uniref:Uncharacterized protein n=1 Tax=Peribacillus simplex TaxID=1478 RepID=A0A9X8RDR4_9BACI|nr:hypothetical protein SAMN05878482_109122 [Peribacillus simplex]